MKHKRLLSLLLAVCMVLSLLPAVAAAETTTVTDTLNRELTGVTSGSSSYASWSGKTSNSNAVYAGHSAGGNNSIQLRSSNNNSGIVTTASGGKATKVAVTWESNTLANRTLNVYGKNTAYSAATDLYGDDAGTLLGTIVYGTSTELTITGDYEYIGMRSKSDAMYLKTITITWEVEGDTPQPDTFTVTLNPGEADGTPVTVEDVTSPYTLPACPFTAPEGKEFDCWKIDGGETEYGVGATVAISADTTFVAQWKDLPPVVTYTDMMLKRVPANGNVVVIYYPKSGKVMTGTDYLFNNTKHELVAADATLTDDVLAVPAEALRLTVTTTVADDGETTLYTFATADGKYLLADGTHVQLVEEQGNNTLFQLEMAAAGTDNYYIKCDSATYEGSAQYLEYKSGYITVYGMKETSVLSDYTFQFFSEDGEGPTLWNVTYDLNGGEAAFALTQQIASGSAVTLPAKADLTAPSGKGFAGWLNSADNTVYEGGSIVTIKANTTFTAQWKDLYNVYLKADENAEPELFAEGVTACKLPAANYYEAPEGKVFDGWLSSADNTVYAAEAVISELTANTTFTAQWKDAPVVAENKYAKVTEAPEDWSGQYLIVYKDADSETYLAMDSSLTVLDAVNDYVDVSNGYADNVITVSGSSNVYFTIAKNGTGYSIVSQSGKYVNQTSDANGLPDLSAAGDPVTIELTVDGDALIKCFKGAVLRFNSASNQMRFRFYKSTSYEGQKAIYLYKLVEDEPETLENGFYLLKGKNWNVDEINAEDQFGANVNAGGEYILAATLAEGDQIKVVKVENGAIVGWYPDGENTQYTVDAGHAGNVNIYFRESGNNDWSAFGGYFYIEAGYNITCVSGEHGLVSTTHSRAAAGATVTVYLEAEDDYEVDTLTVMCGGTAVETTKVNDWQYTFVMPAGDVTITATFAIPATEPTFKSQSLILDGMIGVSFNMELPEMDGVDYATSYMTFSIAHGTCTERVNYSAAKAKRSNEVKGFVCYVTAVMMAEPITATFHYTQNGTEKTVEKVYAVKDYFTAYDEKKAQFNAKTQALIESVADYGHYAQAFLATQKGWTFGEDGDYYEMDKFYKNSYDISSITSAVENEGITCTPDGTPDFRSVSFALVCDSATEIRILFSVSKSYAGTFTATVDNDPFDVTMLGQRKAIQIANVPAHELSKTYTIVVTTENGSAEITASALSYVKILLAAYAGNSVAENAAAAIYGYSAAADAYREAH